MTNIKIFISYKDKHQIIKSEIFQPIQTGRAIANKIFPNMIGDDTGDNISTENPKYNELSAQYWVWKHYQEIGEPDYIGFMHYRRHFIFDNSIDLSNKKTWLPKSHIYRFNSIHDCDYANNLSSDLINASIADNSDCIVLKPYDVKFLLPNNIYMKEHYLNTIPGAKRINFETFYDVISELYPEYNEVLNEFTYGSNMYLCNMFIMKKDLFFEYSKFCFDILSEIDKRIDSSDYKGEELRFLGFLGEYLLSIFVLKLQKNKQIKIKYLNGSLIENPDNANLSKNFKNLYQSIFSITNIDDHKLITILGLKIKYKNRSNKELEKKLDILTNKVTELQKELIIYKYQEKKDEH